MTGIDLAKQGIEIYPSHFPLLRSYQTSIGVQRDLGHDMVLTVDWARRQGENTNLGEVDVNHFTRIINGVQTPVIPICTPHSITWRARNAPPARSRSGLPEGRSVYDGLLIKLNKRFSNHFNFVASYALQKSLGEDATQDPLNFFRAMARLLGLGKPESQYCGHGDAAVGLHIWPSTRRFSPAARNSVYRRRHPGHGRLESRPARRFPPWFPGCSLIASGTLAARER